MRPRAHTVRVAVGVALFAVAFPACTRSDPFVMPDCARDDLGGKSVARVWNEALLDAIRRDVPAPTVHARNLFHVSAAMWDAWAAFDPVADGYVVRDKQEAEDVHAARETAISYAAYRLLLYRYSLAAGLQETFDDLAATMRSLCYRIDYIATDGDSPAALGNRIAAEIIDHGRNDGSLEDRRYVDTGYRSVNAPLVVAEPGAKMNDPNRWQPLALSQIVAQNGVPIPGNVQSFIGPHWGFVKGFALAPSSRGTPIDPGRPPELDGPHGGSAFKQAAVDVIRFSSELDPEDGQTIDISPGVRGDNSLGMNDGDGHDLNPATEEPYESNRVLQGDFARAIAEYWADGPESETPPGHWNTIANEVSDSPDLELRLGGKGPVVDRLEWDVKLYFAVNGAVHDSAVAAWGLKSFYDSARPISMIRYMGGKGQSSHPGRPAYAPDGLPLVPGLIEVVTHSSSSPGKRHEHLAQYVDEIAIRAWRGNPSDPESQSAGVGWIRAEEWVPFQRSTFVSPAFAGYVSGHSTFSRAAAELLAEFTGSEFFPGGLAEWTIEPGDLVAEAGPSRTVTLQWATYFDASDQAGISRLFGGIHIAADDFAGRKIGSICGKDAWKLARTYFDGSARI